MEVRPHVNTKGRAETWITMVVGNSTSGSITLPILELVVANSAKVVYVLWSINIHIPIAIFVDSHDHTARFEAIVEALIVREHVVVAVVANCHVSSLVGHGTSPPGVLNPTNQKASGVIHQMTLLSR